VARGPELGGNQADMTGDVATLGVDPSAQRDRLAPAPGGPAPRAAHRRRHADGWDALGIFVTALTMLAVHHAATAANDSPMGHSRFFVHGTTVIAVASVVLLVALIVRHRPSPGHIPRLLGKVWLDPPGAWAAGILGVLLALPVLGLYTPVLLGDADSARVVAAVLHVRTHGIDYLRETQDNFIPQLVVGPAVALAGLAGAKLAALVSLQVLAGLICYVTQRITGSMLGAAAATIALLAIPSAVSRAGFVPLYPAMLALGYLGGWCAYLAITRPDHRWLTAVAAGVCLALAIEAQPVGQLFLAAPVLLLVFAPTWRAGLWACGRIYVVVIVALIPRVATNLSVDGLERLTSYRTDYWITEGYVREIQSRFWNYPGVDEPLSEYLSRLPWRFTDALGAQGYIVLALAVTTWLVLCRGRGRLFVLVAVAFMVVAVTVKQVPPFPRYYSPLWPGLAVLTGFGVAELAPRRGKVSRTLAFGAVAVLVAAAGSSLVSVVHEHDAMRAAIDAAPYRQLAGAITDGKGVIGARSHSLLNVRADVLTWGGQFLSEDEYVTYLTWPSDEAVIQVLERHDIGWVLIHPKRFLETDYHNVWLIPHHGRRARHIEQLSVSPAFCRWVEINGFVLYRLGSCAADPVLAAP
jgi:hypothetical protein